MGFKSDITRYSLAYLVISHLSVLSHPDHCTLITISITYNHIQYTINLIKHNTVKLGMFMLPNLSHITNVTLAPGYPSETNVVLYPNSVGSDDLTILKCIFQNHQLYYLKNWSSLQKIKFKNSKLF